MSAALARRERALERERDIIQRGGRAAVHKSSKQLRIDEGILNTTEEQAARSLEALLRARRTGTAVVLAADAARSPERSPERRPQSRRRSSSIVVDRSLLKAQSALEGFLEQLHEQSGGSGELPPWFETRWSKAAGGAGFRRELGAARVKRR